MKTSKLGNSLTPSTFYMKLSKTLCSFMPKKHYFRCPWDTILEIPDPVNCLKWGVLGSLEPATLLSQVFIAGADYGRFGKSFLVDISDDGSFAFEELPPISMIRQNPSCGAFHTNGGDIAVIAMGGDHYVPPLTGPPTVTRVLSSTEIFHLGSRIWTSGPDLPRGFNLGGCANDLERNSVILAGGFGSNYQATADLIQFEPGSMMFQTMPGVLASPKQLFGMTSFSENRECA